MYVRDHTRPQLHQAMGLDPGTFDRTVLRITSDITRQVFPIELDLDHPRFYAGLDRLYEISLKASAAKARGGLLGRLTWAAWGVAGAACFARLYLLPVKRRSLPEQVRLAPIW
jgi:magnesium-protoporphyrin IX monomethyl ester (oxidative) cyclase